MACCCFALALTPVLHLEWQRGDLAHFFYVGNIAVQFNHELDTVKPWLNLDTLWSLAVEEQFYLVWPLLLLGIATRKPLRWIAGFMGFALFLRLGLLFLLPTPAAAEWSYKVLPMRADGLLCGAVAAILVRAGSVTEAARSLRWPAWLAAVGILAILVREGSLNFYGRLSSAIVFPCLGILFARLLLIALKTGSWAFKIGCLA